MLPYSRLKRSQTDLAFTLCLFHVSRHHELKIPRCKSTAGQQSSVNVTQVCRAPYTVQRTLTELWHFCVTNTINHSGLAGRTSVFMCVNQKNRDAKTARDGHRAAATTVTCWKDHGPQASSIAAKVVLVLLPSTTSRQQTQARLFDASAPQLIMSSLHCPWVLMTAHSRWACSDSWVENMKFC